MKLGNELIESMVRDGMVKAFGGVGSEVHTIVTMLKDCDEATIILRSRGSPLGVLIVADDANEDAVERGVETIQDLKGESDGS